MIRTLYGSIEGKARLSGLPGGAVGGGLQNKEEFVWVEVRP